MFTNLFNSLHDITTTNNDNNNCNNSNLENNANHNAKHNEKISSMLSLMKNITTDTLDKNNLNSTNNNLGIKCNELVIEIHNNNKNKNNNELPTTVNNTYNYNYNFGTNNYSNNYNLNDDGKKTHNNCNHNKKDTKFVIKNNDDKHFNNKKCINSNYKHKNKNKNTSSCNYKLSIPKKFNKKLSTYNKEKKHIILDLFNKYKINNDNSTNDIESIMNSNISNNVNNEKKNVKLYLVNDENVCITFPKIYLNDLYNSIKDIFSKCVIYSICSSKINIYMDTERVVVDSFIKDKQTYLENIQSNLKDIKFEIYNKILYNKELTIREKKNKINDFNNRY